MHFLNGIFIILIYLPFISTGSLAEGRTVYRCSDERGATVFSQKPCRGVVQEVIVIRDEPVGRSPKVIKKPGKKKKTKKRQPISHQKKRIERSKRADSCKKKELKLEQLEWRMRRGYKAHQSAKLHQKRREYEDYLHAFCR